MSAVTAVVIDLPDGSQVLVRITGGHVPEQAIAVDRRLEQGHSWRKVRTVEVRHEGTP